jgi:hypothetical protein
MRRRQPAKSGANSVNPRTSPSRNSPVCPNRSHFWAEAPDKQIPQCRDEYLCLRDLTGLSSGDRQRIEALPVKLAVRLSLDRTASL